MASQEKIAVYSLPDLKNTTDDAIPIYLNSLSFTQSHFLADVRLALGYLAFAICAACFGWDYKFGFDETKHYTAIAVVAYAIVNGVLSFWVWAVEKNTIYVGTNPAGDRIEIQSATKKNVPIYNLTIAVTAAGSGARREITLSRPFREWFDSQGAFIPVPFQQMFASNVDVIGKADPKRVVAEKKKGAAAAKADTSKTMDEKLASLLAESYVDIAAEDVGLSSATPSKPSKKRSSKKA